MMKPLRSLKVLFATILRRVFWGIKRYVLFYRPQPTHLKGLTKPIDYKELLKWFRETQVPDWVNWDEEEIVKRLKMKWVENRPGSFLKKVVCSCGAEDRFKVLGVNGGVHIEETDLTVVHLSVSCQSCKVTLQIFDSQLNGYNAVVCDDRASLPDGYADKVQESLCERECACGSLEFHCYVSYDYDDEDWEDIPPEQRPESFGWFYSLAICSICGSGVDAAEAETA